MDKLDKGEKIKLLELYYKDYEKKHEHLWNIFFKFIYSMVCVLGIATFQKVDLVQLWIDPKPLLLIIEIILTIFSTIIINREYYVVKSLNDHYAELLSEMGVERLPDNSKNIIMQMDIRTGMIMSMMMFIIGMGSSAIILFT